MYKVVIGVPTMEFARQAKFYDYFNLIQKPEGTTISFAHGQSPATNRNLIIENALASDATHIFFIDDDVLVPPDGLMRLLAHDKNVVSGLYLMRNFPHAPIAFNAVDSDGKCRFKFLNDGETGLVPAVNFGLGCCLIRTDVFRLLEKPYIRIGQLNAEEWNDDIEFFNRVRAAGYQLYLDLDVRCGHMATATIWPNYVEDQKKWITTYDTQGSGHASFYAATPIQVYGDDRYEQYLENLKKEGKLVEAV